MLICNVNGGESVLERPAVSKSEDIVKVLGGWRDTKCGRRGPATA